ERADNVLFRDHECVALGNGESVEECHCELVLHPDAGSLQVAEGAVVLVHKPNRFHKLKSRWRSATNSFHVSRKTAVLTPSVSRHWSGRLKESKLSPCLSRSPQGSPALMFSKP